MDVEDISREPINLYFEEAIDFIDSFLKKEENVLVHCRAGVSRSAKAVAISASEKDSRVRSTRARRQAWRSWPRRFALWKFGEFGERAARRTTLPRERG